VLNFVGRWADSEIAKDYQQNFRTARPKMAQFVPGRHRLYTILGSALAAYDIDRFISRLSARPPLTLTPATSVPVNGGNPRYAMWGPPEVFLMWDAFFYAENGGGWITPVEDGLERLWDFDWDDRGNVYLAYSVFGWGIVKDSGETGGGLFRSLSQTVRDGLTPYRIISLKTSDGKYYAAVADTNQTSFMQVWDVQDPAVPVKLPDISGRTFSRWAKDSTSSHVAIIDPSGALSIFTSEGFVRTGTPIIRFESSFGFQMLTSDGTNFYAYGVSGTGAFIDVISPSGNTYVEKRIPSQGYGVPAGMHYGDGYLAVVGSEVAPVGTWNIRLYKVGPGTLTEIPFDMPVPGSNGARQPFWPMYYASAPSGYTAPYYNNFKDAAPIKIGSRVYLVLSAYGLGDVWEVKAGDALTARMSASAETPNPNSAAAGSAGPFYGDRQTFTSTLSSGNTANVSWDFGDNTSGSSVTGGVVKHQYGGVTSTASLPLVRRVTASNTSDPTINDSVSVTLAAPQPRFKIANTAYLFMQPDASSAAPIVAGDSFVDASDGAVEGHYTDWVLGSASNKKLPNEAFSVGSCGAHSLVFNTHYGPYSGTGSAITSSSDLALSISPFNYTVRPYVITVQEPGPASVNDPNAVFTAAVRTAGANDLPAGGATPVTYKWEVINASQATIASANGSATLGTIPAFSVPRTTFSALGLRVRLTTTVTASAVPGAGCSSLATAVVQSSELNGPDPVIVKTGCLTVGSPCSFTVTSAKNPTLAGWSFAWTVNPTASSSGTAASDFRPQFTTTTDYSVAVVVTNGIGSKTATLSGQHIDKPLCSSAPDQVNNAIGIGSNTTPAPGDTVSFLMFPRGWTPSVQCDKFDWSFGDGGTSTEMIPTHVYTNAGTYNVTLILTGALSTATYTTSATIGTTPPPPPPGNGGNNGSCTTPQANSAYVVYTGPVSGCTAVTGVCNPGESVFFVLWPDSGYNLNCGNTTVSWLFGDNTTGTGLSLSHTFATAGIYHVQATVSNSAGTFTYTQDARVGNAQPKPCGTLTQQNVALAWTGTGCTESSGTCKSADSIAFRPVGNGYDFTCTATHTYDWDFGDNSSHSNLAQPSHSFLGAGTFNVKLLVSNGTSSTTITRSVTIGSSDTGVTGCGLMIPNENVYVTFNGDGCNAVSGSCSAKADVTFAVSATGYDLSCGSPTYSWDFGDGGHSTDKAPAHRYTANGTYNVKVHFSNGTQPVDLPSTVKVVNATPVVPRGGHAVRH
jgi:FOG: PKD repeat